MRQEEFQQLLDDGTKDQMSKFIVNLYCNDRIAYHAVIHDKRYSLWQSGKYKKTETKTPIEMKITDPLEYIKYLQTLEIQDAAVEILRVKKNNIEFYNKIEEIQEFNSLFNQVTRWLCEYRGRMSR